MTTSENMMAVDVSGLDAEAAVERLIEHAVSINASDLFLLSNESFLSAQVRHLGLVHPLSIIGEEVGRRCIQHIKAAAGMDVGDRRRPQDGRWIVEGEDGPLTDLRISTIPTLHGEDMAIRFLGLRKQMFALEDLGFQAEQFQLFNSMITSPAGVILITGPTGSGKTATLYSALSRLNDGSRKINTIEDPIEFSVEGVRQSQINPNLGLGYPELLRSIMRQGPDVIMIGEIRDPQTAETAIRAGNTGHLVFATLHAPVAAGAVQSLLSLGIHPHFLSTALRGIVSQRLARTLCVDCRTEFDISHAPQTFEDVKQYLAPGEGKVLYAPNGCKNCNMSGYTSRSGVFEVLPVTGKIRKLIAEAATTRQLHHAAMENGMLDFRRAAMIKVAKGLTSTEEVLRVIPAEHLLLEGEE